MPIKQKILISLFFFSLSVPAQKLTGVYKIDDLINRIESPDTTYVINFWALWCKPCIQELPSFDSLNTEVKNTTTKVLLVNLDFLDDTDKQVNSFLEKKNIKTQCVLLDEINGNNYIDRISEQWSGAIPATLFKNGDRKLFVERKMDLKQIKSKLKELNEKQK